MSRAIIISHENPRRKKERERDRPDPAYKERAKVGVDKNLNPAKAGNGEVGTKIKNEARDVPS